MTKWLMEGVYVSCIKEWAWRKTACYSCIDFLQLASGHDPIKGISDIRCKQRYMIVGKHTSLCHTNGDGSWAVDCND